jgi:argininosuccinate synthase
MTDRHRASGPLRIVLAHSGGLDTAVAIPWLAATHAAEVIAVTIDLGQKKEQLEEIRDRALASGAVRAHVVDVRDEFARDYLVRGLKAGLLDPDPSMMAVALAGPLVGQTLVSIAKIEQAHAVAHGDPEGAAAPLAKVVHALDPSLDVLAVPPAMTTPPDAAAGSARTTASPNAEPAYLEIAIERGVPTAVNGVSMPWAELVGSLEIIERAHGVGSSPLVLLRTAHQALQRAALSPDAERFGAQIAGEYRRMLGDGSWFSPMRAALDAYVDTTQERVGGLVRLKLFNGICTVVEARTIARATPILISVTKA